MVFGEIECPGWDSYCWTRGGALEQLDGRTAASCDDSRRSRGTAVAAQWVGVEWRARFPLEGLRVSRGG
jgi:hypothetical protein